MEKINNGNMTANINGTLEFSFEIKREEIEKFFNSYLHQINSKNKDKDILIISSSEKSAFLLHKIKDALTYLGQSVSITDPATLNMAKMLLENGSFRELIYLSTDEKAQTFNLILTKNKRKICGQELLSIMQKMNLFCSRSFNISNCNYTKNDITYNKKIISAINSIYLALKDNNPQTKISKMVFFETENSFIKNETSKILSPFGLKICEKNENNCFVINIDSLGEKIEKIRYKNQILDRNFYLKYLYQKKIRKNFKIYIKKKELYFLINNLPIISKFGKKLKDVLCETYLFIMISNTTDFLEYSRKNNLIFTGENI
jgi:hypothetical protein